MESGRALSSPLAMPMSRSPNGFRSADQVSSSSLAAAARFFFFLTPFTTAAVPDARFVSIASEGQEVKAVSTSSLLSRCRPFFPFPDIQDGRRPFPTMAFVTLDSRISLLVLPSNQLHKNFSSSPIAGKRQLPPSTFDSAGCTAFSPFPLPRLGL